MVCISRFSYLIVLLCAACWELTPSCCSACASGSAAKCSQQQPVDEDIATADLAQEHPPGAVIQECGVVPGHCALTPEDDAQRKVRKHGVATVGNSSDQRDDQPVDPTIISGHTLAPET